MIICAALDALGKGKLVGLDPVPQIPEEVWDKIKHRTSLVIGHSPVALEEAYLRAGGLFDFVFLDGDHERSPVAADLDGLVPFMRPGAYVLAHDAHFVHVEQGISDVVNRPASPCIDCGLISKWGGIYEEHIDERRVVWSGLQLLRFMPR